MTSADESDRNRWPAVVARALLCALAIVVLVLYGSGQDYVFIYQGF